MMTNKSEHTPGEWGSYGTHGLPLQKVQGEGAYQRLFLSSDTHGTFAEFYLKTNEGEGEANIRLAASAPDLLAACQGAKDVLQVYANRGDSEVLQIILNEVKSAILKATGGK